MAAVVIPDDAGGDPRAAGGPKLAWYHGPVKSLDMTAGR
jgi:hypothetical protein